MEEVTCPDGSEKRAAFVADRGEGELDPEPLELRFCLLRGISEQAGHVVQLLTHPRGDHRQIQGRGITQPGQLVIEALQLSLAGAHRMLDGAECHTVLEREDQVLQTV